MATINEKTVTYNIFRVVFGLARHISDVMM